MNICVLSGLHLLGLIFAQKKNLITQMLFQISSQGGSWHIFVETTNSPVYNSILLCVLRETSIPFTRPHLRTKEKFEHYDVIPNFSQSGSWHLFVETTNSPVYNSTLQGKTNQLLHTAIAL